MTSSDVSRRDKDQWRDYLLAQIVAYLEQDKENILQRYHDSYPSGLTRQQIEGASLMNFDVAISLHCDSSSSFGLGRGFFAANFFR